MYIILSKKEPYFFADTTVNVNPTAEELCDIIGLTARAVRFFDTEPRMAVLSYSNFGSNSGEIPDKARRGHRMAKERYPQLDYRRRNAGQYRLKPHTYCKSIIRLANWPKKAPIP